MTVQLLSTWGSQPPGTLFTSGAATEAAMIAAKQAKADLTGAVVWAPNTGSPGSSSTGTLFAALALTAVVSPGKRQAVGGAKYVVLSAAAAVQICLRWVDGSAALGVSVNDVLVSIAPGAPVTLSVPAGAPFLEYMLVSGGPTFTCGLQA